MFQVQDFGCEGGRRWCKAAVQWPNSVQTVSGRECISYCSGPEIESFVVPVGAFIAVTFADSFVEIGGENMMRKPKRPTLLENKSLPVKGMNWSFAAGTNLFPGLTGKIGRESKQKPNEFAKEIRSFSIVDMSGCNFGDEGLFFLAESLAYNQTLEEVSFAANGITAEGMRAFDRVLQSNIVLKTLNLSGNPIGDEGATGAKAIADLSKKNSNLRVVELNYNIIDYSLEVGYNPIGVDGAKALSEILKFHGNIKALKLGWCQGAICLARSLKVVNEVLTELDLGFNEIRHKANEEVKITSLNLANNFLTKFGQSALADARDHVFEMNENEVNFVF
ncbi:hypothetical protein GH714_036444 [Hevea brasiliensis]|uniref:WPP domain-containing protein n=1 Tax=Hevea brasiliensis TaxID=3981 RepID=A0A6A6LPU1_HEVBR|nr:hypothetical protein GH714_036444 [Hevea brasiliensis]